MHDPVARSFEQDLNQIQDEFAELYRQYLEILEKDIIGAWMAGYSWLHVFKKPPQEFNQGLGSVPLNYTFPAYSKQPPDPDGAIYVESYKVENLNVKNE